MKSSIEPVPHDRTNSKHLTDWRLYAAAGAAALAAGSAADAAIIYVDPSVKPLATLGSGSIQQDNKVVHFNLDGLSVRMGVTDASVQTCDIAFRQINVPFLFTGGHAQNDFTQVKNYALGQPIVGAGRQATFPVLRSRATFSSDHAKSGQFVTNDPGFAGFQLPASKGGGFGWIRFDVLSQNGDGRPDSFEAIDWAYNDAGGGIYAGEGIPSSVPEPSALGLLAMGSAGVLAWRRRRTAPAR